MSKQKKQTKTIAPAVLPKLAPGYFFTHSGKIQALIIFMLGFLLYVNTIPNEYALDDGLLIKDNKWVQQGSKGLSKIFSHGELDYFYESQGGSEQFSGGRYRPLSIATFAIEQHPNLSVAQLVEQLTLNQWVTGSNPVGETPNQHNHL